MGPESLVSKRKPSCCCCRRERQLVSLARRAGPQWTASIKALACTPRARKLLVDVVGHARLDGARPLIVGGNQSAHRGLDERGLFAVQEEVGGGRFCLRRPTAHGDAKRREGRGARAAGTGEQRWARNLSYLATPRPVD